MWDAIVQDIEGDRAVLLRVKAIPNARHPGVAGPLGDRLKVKVNAPPEGGKANDAICGAIARHLKIKCGAVRVVEGATSQEKTVRIDGISARDAIAAFR